MASFYGHKNWYNCGNSNGSKGGYIAPDNTASVGENQRTNNVDIYPIPTTYNITIEFDKTEAKTSLIKVYNLVGERLHQILHM